MMMYRHLGFQLEKKGRCFSNMGEGDQDGIPTIDMENFPEQYEKLRKACEEWGCFKIINHGIPTTGMSEMATIARSLLDLPPEIKKRNTGADELPTSGYLPLGPVNQVFESLGFYDIGLQAVHTFCSQLDVSPAQREIIETYARGMEELILDLAQKVAESIGLVGYTFQDWVCHVKLNKYHFTPETVGSCGVPLHTDPKFLAILHEGENGGGLEVMDNSGAVVPVKFAPYTLFVNLGDIAKAWSNGRVSSCRHRVQCIQGKVRVSIASFMQAPKEGAVEPSPQLVDSAHPRLYVPFTYKDFRNVRESANWAPGEVLTAFLRTQS